VWVDAAAHGHPPITSTNILLGFRAVLGATLGEGLVVEAQGRTAPGRQALLRTTPNLNYASSGATRPARWPPVSDALPVGRRRFERDAAATAIQSLVPVVDVTSAIGATKVCRRADERRRHAIRVMDPPVCRLGDTTMIRRCDFA
jgi:hypothetical protein